MTSPRGVRHIVLACLLSLGIAGPVAAQVVTVPTFRVGTAVFGEHLQDVHVAAAPDGGFIVIWGDYDFGNETGDHATTRRFSSTGVPLGSPVQADTSGHVFRPSIAPDGHGGYAAGWQWIGGGDYLFFGQLLDAQGVPTGSDFETTLNLPGWPIPSGTVVGTASGPVFLWSEAGFWSRKVNDARARIGGDVRVGSGGYTSDAATLPDGGFVTIWSPGFDEPGVMGRVFGPNGLPRAGAFLVGDFGGRVAASPRGGLAVVGARANAAGTAYDAWAQRFDDDGTPRGAPILVGVSAPGAAAITEAEFDDHGNLYVVWSDYDTGTGQAGRPRARAFDLDGQPLGPAVEVGDRPGAELRAARLADDSLVNVWYWQGEAWASIVRVCTAGLAVCGDGVRVAACEECDDGASNGAAPDACRADCRRARCGDGTIDAGEQCDDGNRASCDGCSERCANEAGPVCGDGVREPACGEACDAGAANSDTAPGACRRDCLPARCGDGVEDPGEECDDGNQAACDGCSFDCRTEAAPPALCAPASHLRLSPDEQARFAHGIEEFLELENPATGLGPVFNGARCAECHNTPTIGGSSDRLVTRVGTIGPSGFDPLTSHGGPVLQEQGIASEGCIVSGEVVPAEATIVGRRNTPPLFGLGLVEAIPELAIRLRADVVDNNHDGVSGRFAIVQNRIGRFGWKAQVATLADFAADAYLDEIGITTGMRPDENLPQGGPLLCDAAGDPEDDGSDVEAFTDFMTFLAPELPGLRTREARKGRGVFRRLKCQTCHYDKYRTAPNFPIPALRNRKVPLYSDLLLHDMGPTLADGIPQASASGTEFRTAPLWGVRDSAPYLHDGRAATLADAVAAHGGEATAARDKFVALSAKDAAALIAFLSSL